MFCIFSVPCSSLQLRVARVTEEWNFKLISLTYVFNLNHLLWLAATVLGSIALEWKRSRLAPQPPHPCLGLLNRADGIVLNKDLAPRKLEALFPHLSQFSAGCSLLPKEPASRCLMDGAPHPPTAGAQNSLQEPPGRDRDDTPALQGAGTLQESSTHHEPCLSCAIAE